jgi:hypothetical protein
MTIVEYLQSANSEKYILGLIMDNLYLYQAIDTENKVDAFSGTLYNYFVNECVQKNQYLTLTQDDYQKVMDIYKKLILNLKKVDDNNNKEAQVVGIIRQHREKLIEVLKTKNEDDEVIIPCSEYSYGLQEKVLQINPIDLCEPIIDIGCGQKALLVKDLLQKGKDAFGIDQYVSFDKKILNENWFDFHFIPRKWGTVISHMAFTNHFRRSITYKTSDRARYEGKYLEILESLKPGGGFIYCPRIPEVEEMINMSEYDMRVFSNDRSDRLLDTVHIMRTRI